MADSYLFVYGTLLSPVRSSAHGVMDRCARLLGAASMQAKLYDLGNYPGLVGSDDANDQALGELYLVLDAEPLFKHLDAYEQCAPTDPQPHEYQRMQRTAPLVDGSEYLAWVYEYAWPTDGLKPIASGDYLGAMALARA